MRAVIGNGRPVHATSGERALPDKLEESMLEPDATSGPMGYYGPDFDYEYSSGSVLRHVVIEFAGGMQGRSASLTLNGRGPFIDNVTFRSGRGSGMTLGDMHHALYVRNSIWEDMYQCIRTTGGYDFPFDIVVLRSQFRRISSSCIDLPSRGVVDGAEFRVQGCTFDDVGSSALVHNNFDGKVRVIGNSFSQVGAAIGVRDGRYNGAQYRDSILVFDNVVTGARSTAVHVRGYFGSPERDATLVIGNKITGAFGGINVDFSGRSDVYVGRAMIVDNEIADLTHQAAIWVSVALLPYCYSPWRPMFVVRVELGGP